MSPRDEQPSAALMRLVNGYQVSQAIHVAAALGIADRLKDGPQRSDDLAASTGADPQALYRLLRALAAVGVFREGADRRFALTPLGECLRSDAADPVGPWAAFIGEQYHWETWGHLLDSVRSGRNAFRLGYGMSPWEYRAGKLEASQVFDAAMTALSRRVAEAVLAAYDFSPFTRVVDVGGGQGALLASILARHLGTRGVLFDQPHVVSHAEPVLRAAGVADRCEVIGGDFFEAVPAGGDAYVLKAILHDWEDASAAAILGSCRRAIAPGGRVVVIEREIGLANEAPESKFSDLNMLVMLGGQERTRSEYADLFAAAGFALARIVATAAGVSIVEGVPV